MLETFHQTGMPACIGSNGFSPFCALVLAIVQHVGILYLLQRTESAMMPPAILICPSPLEMSRFRHPRASEAAQRQNCPFYLRTCADTASVDIGHGCNCNNSDAQVSYCKIVRKLFEIRFAPWRRDRCFKAITTWLMYICH